MLDVQDLRNWGAWVKLSRPFDPPNPPFMGSYFEFGRFLPISAGAQILKQRNLPLYLRIFSSIFEIQKNLPLKANPPGQTHLKLG